MKKIVFAFLAASLLGLTVPVFFARAANVPNCVFDKQLAELKATQTNSDLGYLEEIKAELKIRKNILSGIIACAEGNAEATQANLNAISSNDSDINNLKGQMNGKFEDAKNYYETQNGKINDLGLKGSKDLATSLREWILDNYHPLTDQVGNLTLWNTNQDLFRTASNRLSQITQTIKTLNLGDNEDIAALYALSQKDLANATALNQTAKADLLRFAPPTDTANDIKISLDALSQTYKDFFDLSEAVKKLLPM